MNWDNIEKILDTYTQKKHYQLLFQKKGWPKKSTSKESKKVVFSAVRDHGFIGAAMTPASFEEWLSLHQIDGNNYTFVYNLETKPSVEELESLYERRDNISTKIWEFDPANDSDDLTNVLPNLTEITLTGVHRDEAKGKYFFSFLAPCYINGSDEVGAPKVYKRMFFAHCVVYTNSFDVKVVFNPTSNLINVSNVEKDKGHDWTPIANAFFSKLKAYIGDHKIKFPALVSFGIAQVC